MDKKYAARVLDRGLEFPEEEKARDLLSYLRWVAPLVILLASLVDLVLVTLYQKCFHPWRRILAGGDFVEGEESVEKNPIFRRMSSAEQYQMAKESTSDFI